MRHFRALTALTSLLLLAGCGGSELIENEAGYEESYEVDESLLSNGRAETFAGRDGQHYFHLLAGNGQKVLASEGYSTAAGAKRGVATVLSNGANPERYLLREASDGSWYLVLTGGNGAIIGVSEMYSTQSNATRAIGTLVRIVQTLNATIAAAAPEARFEIFKGLDAKYYFNVRAGNGEIILQSQGYTTKSGATNGVSSVKSNGAVQTRYELREARDGKFYFVLKAANGRVIARGETYASKFNAERGIEGAVRTLTVELR